MYELETEVKAFHDTSKRLYEKVAALESEAMKDFGQIKRLKETVVKKDDEMKCLRNVIKNNNSSISKFETENSDLKKTMKREEKDV